MPAGPTGVPTPPTAIDAGSAGLAVCALGAVRLAAPAADALLGDGPARGLLGVLALRPGERVAAAELRAALPDLPVRPAATALRAALAAAGLTNLLAADDEYRLAAGDRVDVARFQRTTTRARALMRAGDLPGAIVLYDRALHLWPADPSVDALGGLAVHGWAAAQVSRLRELRLAATEDRVACALRLAWAAVDAAGAPVAPVAAPGAARADDAALAAAATAAAGLATVLAAHPVRERLWELTLVAGYLTGGRRAAAEAYQRARTAYDEQLGVPPGARLRELAVAAERGELGPGWAPDEPGQPRAAPQPGAPIPSAPAEPARDEPAPAPLPVPLTSLIGRDRLLAEVTGALAAARLVTLTGPGGCGKTRLAIAAAHRIASTPPPSTPASFVDLSEVDRADRVPTAVATALAVRDEPGLDPVSGIIARYRAADLLIVLDNCEHLLGACADLADRLLDRCPGLRILATSRSPLRIHGERVIPVTPLPAPRPGAGHTTEGLLAYPASRLFLERARARTGRPVPEASADAVAALCAELDGLPLAIELAAARTSVLGVAEITARVRADLRLLRSSDPTAPARHRTLTAAVESSVDLLAPPARALFGRLAVFPGTFDRPAAAAMGTADAGVGLDELVRASLVEPVTGPHGTRFRLLGTVRRCAHLALFAAGDEPAARDAHAAHFLHLAERTDAGLRGPDQSRALTAQAIEWPNLLAATAWFATEHAGGGYGDLRLATALASYCHLRGHYRDGRGWLSAALDRHPAAPPALRAPAALGAAMLAMLLCDYPAAAEHAERAAADCERIGDRRGKARAESILGSVARERGDYVASSAHLDQASAGYAELGDEWGEARAAQLRGFTAWLRGDLTRAEPRLRACLRRFERLGDGEAMADALTHLGAVAHYRGDRDRAAALLDASLERYAALGFPEGVAWAHNLRGLVELAAGRTDRANALLTNSLTVHRQVGDRWRTASVLCALAEVARQDGTPRRAAKLLGVAARIRAEIGTPVPACERADLAGTEAALRAVLGDDAYDAAQDAGRDTPLDAVLAEHSPGAYAYF